MSGMSAPSDAPTTGDDPASPDSPTTPAGALGAPTLRIPVRVEIRGVEPENQRTPGLADEGRAAGRYRVEEEIGRGGMGVVYRAFDRDLRRDVAMKVLRPGVAAEGDLVSRFVEEAQATAQLQHPAIVPVYEIGRDADGRLFFTMKLVRGRTLARVVALAREGDPETAREFTPFRLLETFVDICRAVHFAHQRGVIHRDLKPQNVMIGRHGEVQVRDWGLAKVVAGDGRPAPRDAARDVSSSDVKTVRKRADTIAGAIVGTPAYMPPEQVEGDPRFQSPIADVYALGATLFHVLTGRAPFVGASTEEVIAKVLDDPPPRARALDPGIAPELEAICARALAKEPADRYGSALALANDVQAYLEDRPVAALPEGPLRRARKWARRHPALVGSLAAVVIAAAAAGVVSSRLQRQAALARLRAEATEARARFEADRAARLPPEKEGPARRAQLDGLLGAALSALQAASQLAAAAPDDAAARRLAFEAALAAAGVASESEQWALAASVAGSARSLGVDEGRAAEALRAIERARTRVRDDRRRAVEAILADARGGALAARPDGYEDAKFALVRYTEPETVSLVAAALDGVTAELGAAVAAAWLEAATPTADEVRAGLGPIEGIAAAAAEALALPLGAEPSTPTAAVLAAAEHRLVERDARRRDGIRAPDMTGVHPLDVAQLRRLGPSGALLARLCCEVLGRLGIEEGATPALARYIAAERDEVRAAYAGSALCRLGSERARELAAAGKRRFGINGSYWSIVSRHFSGSGAARAPAPSDIEEASRAVELDPGDALAWNNRGCVRRTRRDFKGAIADFDRAIQLDPRAATYLTNRGRARADGGDHDGAVADCAVAIALDPGYSQAWNARGIAREAQGRLEEAIADYSAALDLAPRDIAYVANRARARDSKGDLHGAIDDYSRAIEIDPRVARVFSDRGWSRRRLGDNEGAIADYTRAIEIEPGFAPAWRNRARARDATGDPDGAIADATRATELDPADADSWAYRGLARRSKDELDAAIADFDRAIELAPRTAWLWKDRAIARRRKGDLAGAIADHTPALEIDPSDAGTWRSRSTARARLGDLDGAIADATRAIELGPLAAGAWNNRGTARAEKRDFAGAEADFSRAIELDPRYATAWHNRGIARARAGDRPGAIADLERFLELAPEDRDAGGARARLEELREAEKKIRP